MRPHKNRDPLGAGLHGAAPSVERHEIRACGQKFPMTNVVKSSDSKLSPFSGIATNQNKLSNGNRKFKRARMPRIKPLTRHANIKLPYFHRNMKIVHIPGKATSIKMASAQEFKLS